MDHVELTDLRIDTVVGILDREQRLPQPIIVDVELGLSLEETATTGRLEASIDYAAVQAWITTLAQQGRWRLIESLGAAICRLLLAPPAPGEGRAAIDVVKVRIRKPTILDGAVPGIALRRTASQVALDRVEVAPGVRVETLVATPVQGAWRVHLDAGASWAVPGPWALHVLAGGGDDGAPLTAGDRRARRPHITLVAGDSGMVLLAVGSPAPGH
jgi:FolB domain-containing protein